jgi:DNA (cytosine-5)-methyltransferase 1
MIKVAELFAGVGGFRLGLEKSSKKIKIVWSNQFEPNTKIQIASEIYKTRFGNKNHINEDITKIKTDEILNHDLLVGGFPCQDYSVATTLKNSKGLEGKKGVLWWEVIRILTEKKANKPKYLILENVDRLLNSPASHRGKDMAIILNSLSRLNYIVEWRIINAAEYGMPQRRKRIFLIAYHNSTKIAKEIFKLENPFEWITSKGILGKSFPILNEVSDESEFKLSDNIYFDSSDFNHKNSPFKNSGILIKNKIYTLKSKPFYEGRKLILKDILINENQVAEEFFIDDKDIPKWKKLKHEKSEKRINKKTGFEYLFKEGRMELNDDENKPSRTIITGEGGKSPSRFKHVIKTKNERYRRLTPVELEKLNMFPENHTEYYISNDEKVMVSSTKRAFLMGNALVVGIVQKIGEQLIKQI